MNCLSHYYMGGKVFNAISSEKNILSKRMFQSGNVYPDIEPKLSNISHYDDNCVDTIKMLSENLLSDIERRYVSESELSFRLGHITHFVADYFTYAHDLERFTGNLMTHTMIEARLDYKMRVMSDFDSDYSIEKADDLYDLLSNMEVLKTKFSATEVDYEENSRFIFAACTGFMESMVLITANEMEMAREKNLVADIV